MKVSTCTHYSWQIIIYSLLTVGCHHNYRNDHYRNHCWKNSLAIITTITKTSITAKTVITIFTIFKGGQDEAFPVHERRLDEQRHAPGRPSPCSCCCWCCYCNCWCWWAGATMELWFKLADFPAVFFQISHWYLSWNIIDKSKSQNSVE